MATKSRFHFTRSLKHLAIQPHLRFRSEKSPSPTHDNPNNISVSSVPDEHIPYGISPQLKTHHRQDRQAHFNQENIPELQPLSPLNLDVSALQIDCLQIPSVLERLGIINPVTSEARQDNYPNHQIVIQIESVPAGPNPEETTTQEPANDRQVEMPEQSPEDVTTAITTKAVFYRMLVQFLFNLTLLTTYILGFLYISNIVNAEVLLATTLGVLAGYMMLLIITKGFSSESTANTSGLILSIANSFALTLYVLAALLKYHGCEISLTPFSLLGGFILLCSCSKTAIDTPGPIEIFLLMDKSVLWVELLLIAIRVDGLVVPWGTIFIPMYFALMLLGFSSILIIIASLFSFFTVMRDEGFSGKLILGSIWYILNSLHSIVWLILLTEGVKQLDLGKSNLLYSFRFGIILCGVTLIFNILAWKGLKLFQIYELESEMQDAEEEEESEGYEGARHPEFKFKATKEKNVNLVMISPSFFAYAKKSKANNKKKQKGKKVNEKKACSNVPLNMVGKGAVENYAFSSTKQASKGGETSEGDIENQTANSKLETSQVIDLCTICFDHAPDAVFMDCGHGGVCYECAKETWKKSDLCILCRNRISKVLKIQFNKSQDAIQVVESTKKVVTRVY